MLQVCFVYLLAGGAPERSCCGRATCLVCVQGSVCAVCGEGMNLLWFQKVNQLPATLLLLTSAFLRA